MIIAVVSVAESTCSQCWPVICRSLFSRSPSRPSMPRWLLATWTRYPNISQTVRHYVALSLTRVSLSTIFIILTTLPCNIFLRKPMPSKALSTLATIVAEFGDRRRFRRLSPKTATNCRRNRRLVSRVDTGQAIRLLCGWVKYFIYDLTTVSSIWIQVD